MTVGQNIKRIRMEKNLTQTMLSTRMGYTSNSVLSKLENDHLEPNINHLRRLSLALKVSQASILDVDGIKEEETKEVVVQEKETTKPIVQSQTEPVETKEVVKEELPKEVKHEEVKPEVIEETKVSEEVNPPKVEVIEEKPEVVIHEVKETKPIEQHQEEVAKVEKVKTHDKPKEEVIKKVITKNHPFYSNAITIILSVLLIAAPLVIVFVEKLNQDFYVLVGSALVIIILFISLLINNKKKKRINKEVFKELVYVSKTTKSSLAVFKTILIVLSLGFIALGYLFIDNVKGLITNQTIEYVLMGLLGVSSLIKLLSTLSISIKNPTEKISSNNFMLVLTFIIDVLATLGILVFFNKKNIAYKDVVIYYLVGTNMVSYLLLILTNKYSSIFKLIE